MIMLKLHVDKSAKSGKSYKGGEGVLVFKHAEVSFMHIA